MTHQHYTGKSETVVKRLCQARETIHALSEGHPWPSIAWINVSPRSLISKKIESNFVFLQSGTNLSEVMEEGDQFRQNVKGHGWPFRATWMSYAFLTKQIPFLHGFQVCRLCVTKNTAC